MPSYTAEALRRRSDGYTDTPTHAARQPKGPKAAVVSRWKYVRRDDVVMEDEFWRRQTVAQDAAFQAALRSVPKP